MVLSQFNVYVDNYPQAGYTMIYNTLSKKIMCIRSDLVKNPSDTLKVKMQEASILVPSTQAEVNSVVSAFENNEFNPDELRIVLILTRKCNCQCVYCYEDQQNASFSDLVDVDAVLRFIDSTMSEHGLTKLRILFYGGEPLIKKELITQISEIYYGKLSSNYRFTIITNGTLLEETDLSLWEKIGLESIKVTVDGNRISHNKRRPLKSGSESYDVILNNPSIANKYVHIILNIVIDEEVTGVKELITQLSERGIYPEYALSLREPCIWKPKEKASLVLSYVKLLHDMGAYQSTKIAIEHGAICMGKDRNYFVVDGNNRVYQCNANFQFVIGNTERPVYKPYKKTLSDVCKKCTYLPVCYGDCLFEKKCEKKYFDLVTPELLKIYTAK